MLRALTLHLLLLSFGALNSPCQSKDACSVLLGENALKEAETIKKDKELQAFLTETLQKKEAVLKDKTFQWLMTNLQSPTLTQTSSQNPSGDLYIFVSFSLGEKALENLAHEAKKYGATFVLRGFIEGSYKKTIQAFQKIILSTGQGFIIDPELFTLFSITAIPTYVLAKPFSLTGNERTQTMSSALPDSIGDLGRISGARPGGPLHDRLQGHVSIQYALETFAKEGNLSNEAKVLLLRGSNPDSINQRSLSGGSAKKSKGKIK